MATQNYHFFATTSKGMEPLLAQELRALSGVKNVSETRAGVSFDGDLEAAYRACLWSRIANRVLMPLKTFPSADPDQLYAGVRSIFWTDHLTSEDTLAVDFSSSYSKITHTHFGALKVKDAIVDQFRSREGVRPSVDPMRPSVRVNVYLHEDQATVSLDLSGDSLHKRGYREAQMEAPMKENLAAAILMSAAWCADLPSSSAGARFFAERAFMDPMCGSGTLPIEAAMMAADIAPATGREYFGFLGWQGHIPAMWKRVQAEALERARTRATQKLPRIVGYDENFRAVRVALDNVERAGLRGKVHIEKRELAECDPVATQGIIVVNPPYGERMGEVEALKPLYKRLGDTFKQKFKGWEGYIFTGSPDLAKSVGLRASRRIVLYNGALECRLLKYELYEGSVAGAPTV